MSLNIDLLLVLMMEQEQALVTVDRCRSEITRLLTEQHQRDRSEHATAHEPVEHSAGTPKKQRQQSTQEADSSDEELLEAARLHELKSSGQPTHSTASVQPTATQGTKHTAMQRLPQPDTWSLPLLAMHSISKDHEKPAGLE